MLTKILAGVIVAMLLSGGIGYLIHKRTVARLEAQVLKLQEANNELKREKEKKETQVRVEKARTRMRRKVADEKKPVDEVVSHGDDSAMRDLFLKWGMLPQNAHGSSPAGLGGDGGPGH